MAATEGVKFLFLLHRRPTPFTIPKINLNRPRFNLSNHHHYSNNHQNLNHRPNHLNDNHFTTCLKISIYKQYILFGLAFFFSIFSLTFFPIYTPFTLKWNEAPLAFSLLLTTDMTTENFIISFAVTGSYCTDISCP